MTRFLYLLFLLPCALLGQPGTDIFLLEGLDLGEDPAYSSVKNLTNRDGYDNQPSFWDDQTLLFTSIRAYNQADIFKIDLSSGRSQQLTFTQESEYSPTPMSGGREFSVVRVEADGTQRLWAFPLAGGAPRMLLTKIKPVGYHVWLDDQTLGLFVLGEPHSLYSAKVGSGPGQKLVPSIGRGLQRSPEGQITFIHKQSESTWSIQTIDHQGGESQSVAATLEGAEDFVWTKAGSLLMASGSTIYRYRPGGEGWQPIFDLAQHQVSGITRLAISPDESKLAVVSAR